MRRSEGLVVRMTKEELRTAADLGEGSPGRGLRVGLHLFELWFKFPRSSMADLLTMGRQRERDIDPNTPEGAREMTG